MSNNKNQAQEALNAVKDLASSIESLARLVVTKVNNGESFMDASNELTRQVITLVFASGEVYALEQQNASKKAAVRVVKSGNANYRHNVRNSLGQYAPKSVV